MTKENMDNSMMLPDEIISNKIYFIRGVKVMLDRDLAELYGVLTGNLNKAVKRNIKRFPRDFMFQLSKEEFDNLIFQVGISSWGGTRRFYVSNDKRGISNLEDAICDLQF